MYNTVMENEHGKVARTFDGYDVLMRRMINYDGILARDMKLMYMVYDNGYVKEHAFGFTYRVSDAPDFDAKEYAISLLEKEGR